MSIKNTEKTTEPQETPVFVPVLWCKIDILSTVWEVWVTDEKTSPELVGCEGLCLYDRSVLLIDRTIIDSRKIDVLTHELLHAVISMGGYKRLFETLFGKSKIGWEEREEILVSTFGVTLHDTLMSNGFLTYPEIPESVRVGAPVRTR